MSEHMFLNRFDSLIPVERLVTLCVGSGCSHCKSPLSNNTMLRGYIEESVDISNEEYHSTVVSLEITSKILFILINEVVIQMLKGANRFTSLDV